MKSLLNIVGKFIAITLFLGISSNIFGQELKITGQVTDSQGQPLPGVTVILQGTTKGTITDAGGKYALQNVSPKQILEFSFVGMQKNIVQVGSRSVIDVTMKESATGLNEVMVVGYGTQKKIDVTGSVQTITTKGLDEMPVAQLAQQLQGQFAGVQILQNTGELGTGMSVRIRGQASISAGNQPLYVVDGFPITGDINSLDPNEIESISVLEDASATSLYGSRGANGVVIITTKSAKEGETRLNASTYFGVQQVPQQGRPDMMNAEEFAQFEKEVLTTNGEPVPIDYQNPSQWAGKGTNWYNVLLRTAPIQDVSLSLSTSNNKLSSVATADFFNQNGVLLNSNYKRYSLRINNIYKVNDKLKFGFNVAPNYIINESPNSDGELWNGSIIESAMLTSPLCPYKNPDGSIPLTATGAGLFPNPNWYNVVQQQTNNTQTSGLLSNAYLEIEFLKGLVFKSSVGVELGSAFNKFWSPSTSGAIFAAPPQIAYTTEARSNYESWLSENMLTYTHSFGKNNINALADYSAQKYNYNYNYIYAFGFPDDKINTLNAATNFTASSDVEEWTLLSWVGRLNYNYDNKYLSSVSIRRDGSSRFGYNNQYGNFPSISAGWVISQENFMKRFNPISFLKIRGSYGLTGNNNIGNYSSYAAVSNTNYSFNEALANGRSVTSLSNSDLGWEKTSQLDLGLDLALLAGRISFTYDYYNKITANLLYAVNVPQESGYSNIATNVGEFRFWGHEFSVNTFNLTGIFKWKTNFNISFDRNIVAKLGINNAPIYGAYTITKVGAPIGQFYGYVFNGIYMNQADFDNSPKNVTSAVGSVKYKDISGPNGVPDGIIDANDQTAIGNPNPNYIYGMTNTFNYKDFDLNIVIAGSEGNKIMNQVEEYTQNLDGPFNVLKNVANRWKSVSDPGAGLLPSCEAGTTALARATNSRWVENGSYLTVKNITLGYNMPIKNKGFIIRSARFYVSIQQAFVFTKYSGANPEVSSNGSDPLNLGVDQTAYPVPRTCTIGVNIGL